MVIIFFFLKILVQAGYTLGLCLTDYVVILHSFFLFFSLSISNIRHKKKDGNIFVDPSYTAGSAHPEGP